MRFETFCFHFLCYMCCYCECMNVYRKSFFFFIVMLIPLSIMIWQTLILPSIDLPVHWFEIKISVLLSFTNTMSFHMLFSFSKKGWFFVVETLFFYTVLNCVKEEQHYILMSPLNSVLMQFFNLSTSIFHFVNCGGIYCYTESLSAILWKIKYVNMDLLSILSWSIQGHLSLNNKESQCMSIHIPF